MTPNLQGLTVSLPSRCSQAAIYSKPCHFSHERDQDAVRKEFERIQGPVKLVVFSQELVAGELCRQNEQLVREVAALDDRITWRCSTPPSTASGPRPTASTRCRPSSSRARATTASASSASRRGYEFSNLIDSIIVASSGEAALSEATKTSLAALTDDVDIKVFSTPT